MIVAAPDSNALVAGEDHVEEEQTDDDEPILNQHQPEGTSITSTMLI